MSSINVSDSTPVNPSNSEGYKFSKRALACFEKMEKAEADYEKYLMALLSSADSIREIKQILSDKGELSEDMQAVFDRAINQEEKEQKKASKVPIQLIIKKIQMENNRERVYEIKKLLKKNKAHFKKIDRFMCETIIPTQSEIEENQVYGDLELNLWTEYSWLNKKLSSSLYTGEDRANFMLAESWPNYIPNFEDIMNLCSLSQMGRKISQESNMDESDSDKKAYEDSLINVSGISINVSDSTPSLLRNSRRYTYSDKILAGIEKKEKAEADYVKYLMALLSSADSLGQVKQILSDKGELSEDMREALDRAINQEEKEQKKASKVPIQLIIKKIQIMKNRERIPELYKLYNKNQVKLQKYEHRIFNSTLEPTQSEREERRVLSNLGLGFLAELLWIDENLNPNLCTGEKKEKLKLAESWPNSVPNFEDIIKSCRLSQMESKISQKSDMYESDSDEEAYEDSLINESGMSLE